MRDKFVSAGHDLADIAQATAKHAVDRAQGVMATGHLDRESTKPPQNEQQLHERVRARLGRLVQHPRHVDVDVQDGRLRLTGHALSGEVDALVSELQAMPGVRAVDCELQLHRGEDEFINMPAHQMQPALEDETVRH